MLLQDVLNLLRPNIKSIKPYVSARMESGSESLSCIKLDANESPFVASPFPVNESHNLDTINRYPKKQEPEMVRTLANLYKVKTGSLMISRGMDEALDVVMRCFVDPGEDIVVSFPTFGFYEVSCNIQGGNTIKVPLEEVQISNKEYKYIFNEKDIVSNITPKTKVVILCNPNNPTGNVIALNQITYILENSKCVVVVDEAYLEFCDEYDSMTSTGLIDKYPNLIVTKTLSKAYGLAGARIGCAISNPDLIDVMMGILHPYPIAQSVTKDVLKALTPICLNQAYSNIKAINKQRELLYSFFAELDGVNKIYQTHTNFLLIEHENPEGFVNKMRSRMIIVRNRSADKYGLIRISIGTEHENKALIDAITDQYTTIIPRSGKCYRATKETEININLVAESGELQIRTGMGFFDHMLHAMFKNANIKGIIDVKGDFETGSHHTVEDVAICIGKALQEIMAADAKIVRYGSADIVMDEAKADVSLDLCGRSYCVFCVPKFDNHIENFEYEMLGHFFDTLAKNAMLTCHIYCVGENSHHICEAVFKSFGSALKVALKSASEINSTKGCINT